MATTTSHNKRSSAVKRILSEAREISSDKSDLYTAAPLEDNIFEWHFTLRGPISTEFSKGLYHGRIILPAEYPMRPPDLMLLTPNGRWELNKKICLTFTGYHENLWQPAWGIRTALLGLQTFMSAKAEAAVGIGALDYPINVRERLAQESRRWTCPTCSQTNLQLLPDPDPNRETKQESLPEGLTVDLSGKGTSSSPDATHSNGATPERRDPTSANTDQLVNTSTTLAAISVAETQPADTSSSQLRAVAPSLATSRPAQGSIAPTYTPTATIPTMTRSSQTLNSQQKLLLIDRCIALLAALIALLIVKRLV